MRISLVNHENSPEDGVRPIPTREVMHADVTDATEGPQTWAGAARDAAWDWCLYTGGPYVTALAPGGDRICTVGCMFHDE